MSRAFQHAGESRGLVVVTTAAQLALVVVVWLLALIPAALAALALLGVGAVRRRLRADRTG
ncbi:hypothetical protein [uncultured Caulobacter sp.]|uniref:hypothetical protein n=1 Tax=uncultured Caulobacter sp. TaxID=158749 RepID=UPI00260A56C1|nr:hypothetical protein [uncultured Caulobacter sp.]